MELEVINKLYLELSQVATAKTAKEVDLEKRLEERKLLGKLVQDIFNAGYQACLASQAQQEPVKTKHHPICDRRYPSLCDACNAEAKEDLQTQQLTQEHFEVAKKALRKLACLGNGDTYGNSIGNQIAIDALMALTIPPAPEGE